METKMFNVRWPKALVQDLDKVVSKMAKGRPAHATTASRSTVLRDAFKLYSQAQKNAPKREEEHPAWEQFLFFWNRGPRRGSRSQAWKAWKRYADSDELPGREVIVACFNDAMEGPNGWKAKANTSDEKFIPHFSTWLNGPPWAGWAARQGPEAEPETEEEDGGTEEVHEAISRLSSKLRIDALPACMAAAMQVEKLHDGWDLGLLPHIEASMLQDLKSWAATPAGSELRLRYLAMVRQSSDLQASTWDELIAAARTDAAIREMAGRVFVQVLREVYGVPLPFSLEDP